MRLTALSVLALASVAVTACSQSPTRATSNLQINGDPGAVVNKINDVPARTPYEFELMAVCTTKGAASITSIDLIKPDNVKLLNWGVRTQVTANDVRANGLAIDLSQLGGFSHQQVSNPCGDSSKASELGVTLTKSEERTAQVHGFYIHYSSGGNSGTLLDNFNISMCPAECPRFVR